jgi:hypothetical protein
VRTRKKEEEEEEEEVLPMNLTQGGHKGGQMVKAFMVSGEYITRLQYFTTSETKCLNQ